LAHAHAADAKMENEIAVIATANKGLRIFIRFIGFSPFRGVVNKALTVGSGN
jgi:hypothetical protein